MTSSCLALLQLESCLETQPRNKWQSQQIDKKFKNHHAKSNIKRNKYKQLRGENCWQKSKQYHIQTLKKQLTADTANGIYVYIPSNSTTTHDQHSQTIYTNCSIKDHIYDNADQSDTSISNPNPNPTTINHHCNTKIDHNLNNNGIRSTKNKNTYVTNKFKIKNQTVCIAKKCEQCWPRFAPVDDIGTLAYWKSAKIHSQTMHQNYWSCKELLNVNYSQPCAAIGNAWAKINTQLILQRELKMEHINRATDKGLGLGMNINLNVNRNNYCKADNLPVETKFLFFIDKVKSSRQKSEIQFDYRLKLINCDIIVHNNPQCLFGWKPLKIRLKKKKNDDHDDNNNSNNVIENDCEEAISFRTNIKKQQALSLQMVALIGDYFNQIFGNCSFRNNFTFEHAMKNINYPFGGNRNIADLRYPKIRGILEYFENGKYIQESQIFPASIQLLFGPKFAKDSKHKDRYYRPQNVTNYEFEEMLKGKYDYKYNYNYNEDKKKVKLSSENKITISAPFDQSRIYKVDLIDVLKQCTLVNGCRYGNDGCSYSYSYNCVPVNCLNIIVSYMKYREFAIFENYVTFNIKMENIQTHYKRVDCRRLGRPASIYESNKLTACTRPLFYYVHNCVLHNFLKQFEETRNKRKFKYKAKKKVTREVKYFQSLSKKEMQNVKKYADGNCCDCLEIRWF